MNHALHAELERLGLSDTETQVYLVLVQNASRSASSIAAATGLSRTSVYQMLGSLADKGLVEAGVGYGSRFSVMPPEEALTSLVVRERATLSERERLARSVGQQLASLLPSTEAAPEELIQVIRNRKVVAERFERLQLETERTIDIITKPPFFGPPNNPTEEKVLRRKIRGRSLYERAALGAVDIEPYIAAWIAMGEEARVYEGRLPHKLAIFDSKTVLMPLIMPGDQTRTLLIRHPQLAESLTIMFESLWKEAQPIAPFLEKNTLQAAAKHSKPRTANGAESAPASRS